MVKGLEEIIKEKKEEILSLNESVGDLELYIRELSALLPVSICTLSPIGVIIDANRALEIISGYSLVEIAGRLIETLILEKSQLKRLFEKLNAERVVNDEEFTLVAKSGKTILVSLSAASRRDQEENVMGYFFVITDITERKRSRAELERQVDEKTKELQKKITELEKINQLTLKRELRMIELKEEIKKLKE